MENRRSLEHAVVPLGQGITARLVEIEGKAYIMLRRPDGQAIALTPSMYQILFLFQRDMQRFWPGMFVIDARDVEP